MSSLLGAGAAAATTGLVGVLGDRPALADEEHADNNEEFRDNDKERATDGLSAGGVSFCRCISACTTRAIFCRKFEGDTLATADACVAARCVAA